LTVFADVALTWCRRGADAAADLVRGRSEPLDQDRAAAGPPAGKAAGAAPLCGGAPWAPAGGSSEFGEIAR